MGAIKLFDLVFAHGMFASGAARFNYEKILKNSINDTIYLDFLQVVLETTSRSAQVLYKISFMELLQ